jgi:hypothetical protein
MAWMTATAHTVPKIPMCEMIKMSGMRMTWKGTNAQMKRTKRKGPAHRTFQSARAYPVTDDRARDRNKLGKSICTEVKNPLLMPSQETPVQSVFQALPHGSSVNGPGRGLLFEAQFGF